MLQLRKCENFTKEVDGIKRFFAALLALVILLGALPGAAAAATEEEHKKAYSDTRYSYTRSLKKARRSSFQGYCGLMTSYQLWILGINSWCASYNGKDQWNAYYNKTVTTGGHYIKAYSGSDFTIREVLELITQDGTQDAYNIMLCFQRTHTEAGKKYGHSCLINAILDGTVYMVESYDSALGGKEGTVIQKSIAEVAAYYEKQGTFEGAVWFGTGIYADACDSVTTDLLLQARFDTTLRSQPAPVGQNGSKLLRSVKAGERLQAVRMLTDSVGQRYYEVSDGEISGYVAAGAFAIRSGEATLVVAQNMKMPATFASGTDPELQGSVISLGGRITGLEFAVKDAMGTIVQRDYVECESYRVELEELNKLMELNFLESGDYSLELYADTACDGDGGLATTLHYGRNQVYTTTFRVGEGQPEMAGPEPEPESASDGWVQKDGQWYYYLGGLPCAGWVKYNGVQYLLDANGAAVTGWLEMDGVEKYFSATGALCTGWLQTDEGMTYRTVNGTPIIGLHTLAGSLYYFNDKGILQTSTKVTVDGVVYALAADGKATLQ